jgi:hypothetical protein
MFLSPDISGLSPSLVTKLVRKAIDVDEFPSFYLHTLQKVISLLLLFYI